MVSWSLSTEFVSFVLVLILAIYSQDRKYMPSFRSRIFQFCLYLTMGSILLNSLCVYTINNYETVPHSLNMALNNCYFLVSLYMGTVLAIYVFELILEHVYSKSCRTRAYIILGVMALIYTVLVITNSWTNAIYWFDQNGIYHMGPLNRLGYFIIFIELCMLVICYITNRKSVSKNIAKVILFLSPLVILLIFIQFTFPQLLLNGTIIAFSEFVLFVNFQTAKLERDSLTGLGNRKSFYEEISLHIGGNQPFQVILISLVNFEMINQKFGYRAGDGFLYMIAQWLNGFAKTSRAYRFGNVSFALVCQCSNIEQGEINLQRVRERFSQDWELGERMEVISARYCNMLHEDQGLEATQVVEALVYMAEDSKKKDKSLVCYEQDLAVVVKRREYLKTLLKDSLAQKRFFVCYQPIYNCATGKFSSAEALLRLRDEDGLLIEPAEFIPLAEREGLIGELSWLVLAETCRFLGQNRNLCLESVSINLSVQQFMNNDLCEKIEYYLTANQVQPQRLKLEMTERVIHYDQDHMVRMMNYLREQGLGFYLDDFGTGYSNLASVMHFPFECVKLDRSLFTAIVAQEKDRLIVGTMIDLFHSLGMSVLSEGIETQEQEEIVKSMGTDKVQGYYYAKPMAEEELISFFKDK